MDLAWDAPPEEDFDALMEDEDELEYIREMEIEQRQRKLQNIENKLEIVNKDSVLHDPMRLNTNREAGSIEDEGITQKVKRAKLSNAVCTEIDLSPSPPPSITFSPNKKRLPFREISNQNDHEVAHIISNDGDTASFTPHYRIPQIGERKFYRRIPKGTDFQSITMEDGDKFYIRLLGSDNDWNIATKNAYRFRSTKGGLCGMPYAVLRQRAILEQTKLISEQNNQIDGEVELLIETTDRSVSNLIQNDITKADDNNNDGLLWVEKFRPRSFLHLLSDDGTNRTLLRWLKLWDKHVFNKEIKRIKAQDNNIDSEATSDRNLVAPPTEVVLELDEHDRPKQKCALLYGPPGLGKTTLAHVIASTAGYNAVEMNASNDRSLEMFQQKLEAATQMKSVLNHRGDQRPNCLIIDEIDGCLPITINFLVSLITGAAKNSSKSKNKGKNTHILQRPVICICNDLYVPALRPLRQHALLVPFPPTLTSRLAQRLHDISSKENLRTDLTALMALAEKTDNDIRSCLSTLQFFKSKGKCLRAVDVHKTHLGQKDTQKGLFVIWYELFQIPRSSSKRKFVTTSNSPDVGRDTLQEENLSLLPVRFRTMLRSIQACGDYEKIMQGVFENYLEIKFKDVKMQSLLSGNEWFQFFDLVQQQMLHYQNYATMGYLPFSFVASHLFFGASGPRPKIAYPSAHFEKKAQLQKSKNLVDSMISEMPPASRIFSSPITLVCDILPCLLQITQPNLRAVNTQLYSQREKQELRHLVEIMTAYNLNYVQERTFEGQYIYRLDPELEEVAHFPNLTHRCLPYAVKQIIAHEVDVEKMRRKEPTIKKESTISNKRGTANEDTVAPPKLQNKETAKLPTNYVPNHLQKLKAKNVEVKERVPVDFFGRKIEKSINVKQTPNGTSASDKGNLKCKLVSSDVWFKFKEGYNNAVRRNIRVKDLL